MKKHAILVTFLVFSTAVANAAEPELIYPRALRHGDTVTIVAPAGDLDARKTDFAVQRLRDRGFRVKLPPNLFRWRGYLAGTDEERATELMAAFRDREVSAIFCGGGGFGTTRMLDRLDYDVIEANPKILTGFSDVTGLHLAVHRKTGLVTFHSPFLSPVMEDRPNPFTGDYFWRAIDAEKFQIASGSLTEAGYAYTPAPDSPSIQTISPGTARGRLVGGNLSLICALMGTPYEMETKGRILFIEDLKEEPYRIDRFLSQLKLAGKLQAAAGVVLGVFVDCDARSSSESLTLEQVFLDYFDHLGVPVISGFPVGHFKYNATLPLGAMAELNADQKLLRLLENPVVLPDTTGQPSSP